jgi:hypothetical protein
MIRRCASTKNSTAGSIDSAVKARTFAVSELYCDEKAARQQGLRVPTDLSFVGFDDLPESPSASPPLTTVRQPLSEMGMLAARTVLRLVRGEAIETLRFELATQLVVRESTAAPREQRPVPSIVRRRG